MQNTYRFGFIGAGAMASAIAGGMVKQGLCSGADIIMSDCSAEKLQSLHQSLGIQAAADNNQVMAEAQYIIVAVKPQQFAAVCSQLNVKLQPQQAVISIMAGVTMDTLEEQLGDVAIFRVMPNTPAKIGWGMTGITAGARTTEEQKQVAADIFNSVGQTVFVEEQYMDAVCALSGSGPAYMYQILEALADGAVLAGLPRATAYQLAAQTMAGSAMMLLETGEHPGVLKDQVTSPAGTTICGLRAMEERGVRSAMIEAVQQAYIRSKELGRKDTGEKK